MDYVVLDTDVVSQNLKGRLAPPLVKQLVGRPTCITFVTYGELTTWANVRALGQRRRQELARWLSGIPVLPGERDVAQVWGGLAARANQRGRPRPQNDMWIAACCLHRGLSLATLNVKDYQDFVDHEGLTLIHP